MNIKYDKDIDAAYIYLKSEITKDEVDNTYCCDVDEVGGMINLDFDKNGRLLGIEVLGAKNKLPREVVDQLMK